MPTYNFSDGDVTFTGISSSDTLTFSGAFDHKNFSFLKDNDDLVIYADNGNTVTITNHFLNTIARIETLDFGGGDTLDLSGSVYVSSTSTGTPGSSGVSDVVLAGDGDNWGSGTISGQEGADTIYAGGGNDNVEAGEGNDTVFGGEGDDSIKGRDDNDTLYGGAGEDTIYGGDDNDTIYGGDDNDTIYGGDGNDQNLSGDNGNDVIYGENGNDNIYDSSGDDIIYGGDGDDTIDAVGGDDEIYGGNGSDSITFNGNPNGADSIIVEGNSGDDDISIEDIYTADVQGGAGDDDYYVRGRSNYVQTSATIFDESGEHDTFESWISSTSVSSTFQRIGNDLVISSMDTWGSYDHVTTIQSHFIPQHTIETINDSTTTFSLVEILTPNNDTYTATSSTSPLGLDSNIVDALDGDDTIYAGIGGDIVYGRGGDDDLYGHWW